MMTSKSDTGASPGDYVVATKWFDGDPGDPFCIGFYHDRFDHHGTIRHLVADGGGKLFLANGFRRIARVGVRRGTWMVRNLATITQFRNRYSVWHWYRAPWAELQRYEGTGNAGVMGMCGEDLSFTFHGGRHD